MGGFAEYVTVAAATWVEKGELQYMQAGGSVGSCDY